MDIRKSAVFLFAFASAGAAHAEFELNWASVPGVSDSTFDNNFNCNRGVTSVDCVLSSAPSSSDPDKTPFLQQLFTASDGNQYYHMIVGEDPAAAGSTSTFGMEIYVRADRFKGNTTLPGAGCTPDASTGNGCAPLGTLYATTGNGGSDPTAVKMRMVIKDGEVYQEFLKDSFSQKPVITQNISIAELSSSFVLDMRNSDYLASTTADNATPGTLVNTLTFTDPNVPGNFDTATTAQNFGAGSNPTVTVSGGRYTYTGWSAATYSDSWYSYLDGGKFDITTVDWDLFRRDDQNPLVFGATTTTRAQAGNVCKGSSPPPGC